MMGHRETLKNGDEYDVVTGWRQWLVWCTKAGATRAVKTRLNKRARKAAKETLRCENLSSIQS